MVDQIEDMIFIENEMPIYDCDVFCTELQNTYESYLFEYIIRIASSYWL